jgi:hypothetical protein
MMVERSTVELVETLGIAAQLQRAAKVALRSGMLVQVPAALGDRKATLVEALSLVEVAGLGLHHRRCGE